MADSVDLPSFPAPLRWLNAPAGWSRTGDDELTITAGPRTDLFSDPAGPDRFSGAPALLGELDGDVMLSARVRCGPGATFDAGVLLLHADEASWAKLCVEWSPQGRPTIVSVVNRGVSDDCNNFILPSGDAWLRIARTGSAYAFHAATGDGFWHLIRYFALDGDPRAGFLAQSPTGEGCTVRFSEIRRTAGRPADLRDGS